MSNSDLLIAQLQRRNRIMFGSMLGGFAVIAIGLGVVLLDAANQAPAPTDAQTPPAQTNNQQANSASAPATSGPSPTTTGVTATEPTTSLNPADLPEDKRQFLSAMQEFNRGVKTELELFPEMTASPDYLQMIGQLEADLVSLTGQNRYKDASTTLANTATALKTMMAAELDKFDQLIGEADIAWQKKELALLAGILTRAGAIYQGNQDPLDHFLALAADWPAVSEALQRADAARIENNLTGEQQALQVITRLQHDMAGLDDRVAAVGQRLHQQRVDDLLGQIAAALSADDAGTARAVLTQLQTIAPNTPELRKLRADTAQLEEQIAFQTTMRAIDQFAADDNWAAAQKLASGHRQKFNTYQKFQQRADFIERVHQLMTSMRQLLNAPDELIKHSAQKRATGLIADAQSVLAFSPTLTTLTTALSTSLTSYTAPLDIIVVSDNVTFVEVKSIGQVGVVAQKSIQLPPGDYLFVGKRKGYVTIQVPVALRPGDSGRQITVIADEPI